MGNTGSAESETPSPDETSAAARAMHHRLQSRVRRVTGDTELLELFVTVAASVSLAAVSAARLRAR